MGGWIKLHRKLKDSPIFNNERLLKAFIWCLLEATHSGYEQMVGRQKVWLEPGQFVTGRFKAGSALSMSPSTAWSYLKLLEAESTIKINSNNKYSIVTIENWSLYQSDEKNIDNKITTNEQQMDNKITTNEQQMDTNKKVKKVKNDKNIYTVDFEEFWSTYPGRRIGKKPALKKWKSRLKEGVTAEELTLAAKKYASRCKFEKTEEQYIMRAETFLGPNERWKDWLDWQPPSPQQTMGKDVPGGGVPNASAYKPVDPEAVRRWKELNKDEYR